MKPLAALLDRLLNPIYALSVYIAAMFLFAMGGIILTSIISRQLGIVVHGLNEYAGFCMAASTFFALSYTFASGRHIRIELFLSMMSSRIVYWINVFCYVFSTLITTYATYYFFNLAQVSFFLHEKSQGMDATPLWIPQSALVAGFGLFALCCLHHLVRLLATPIDRASSLIKDELAPVEARLGE